MNRLKGQSMQRRNIDYHARYVQGPEFEEKWMTANSREALRDIVLSSHKRRH
jgi:hypothetical protein